MDPSSQVEKLNRNQFDHLMENDAILEEVSNRIFGKHSERNDKVN